MNFKELCLQVDKGEKRNLFMGTLLSLDPGETTGVAVFSGGELKEAFQAKTGEVASSATIINPIIQKYTPSAVVVENYRVYGWKAKEHAWSDLHTSRLIGAIEVLFQLANIPLFKQSAQIAKQFCTDQKLKEWDFWQKGQPHSRDAIRHGCYYILFGDRKGLKSNETCLGEK